MNVTVVFLTICITVGAYVLSLYLSKRYPHPLVNVVLISTALIIIVLFMTRVSYSQYQLGSDIMTFLLGPATVSLAVPIYRNRDVLLKSFVPMVLGIIIGATGHVVSTVMIATLLNLNKVIILSLAPKGLTTPIALGVSKILNGDPSLTAAFVITTGIAGAIITPWLLNSINIYNHLARGLAYGTSAHGIGTAAACLEGDVQGTMSGVAMGLAAIYISFVAPLIVPWLVK